MINENDKLIDEVSLKQGRSEDGGMAEKKPTDMNYLDLLDLEKLRADAEEEVEERMMGGQLYSLDYLCGTKARQFLENGRTYLTRAMERQTAWTTERSDRVEEQMKAQTQRELKYNAAKAQFDVLSAKYEERFGQKWVKPVKTDKLDTAQNATVLMGEAALDYFANLNK